MSIRPLLSPPAALALAALLLLTACDQWALFVNSDGVLSVSIFSDGSQPQDRFRVRVRQPDGTIRVLDVPASGPLTLSGAAGSTVELTLLSPEGCQVSAPNPRTVSPGADQTVGVVFDVHCGKGTAIRPRVTQIHA
ncbi:MAG TPA: hypothetical protein VGR09_13825 [Gemmatimonadales bacterium]|nr:hypothetical protein [Gemmatimonadales bacterium]